MENLLIYLAKSSGLLLLFYLSYQVLLKKDTSFQLNRKFLLAGLFTSAVLPHLYFIKKVLITAPNFSLASSNVASLNTFQATTPQYDGLEIAGFCYLIITAFFLLRFCFQLFAILKIIASYPFHKSGQYRFINNSVQRLPISFFHYIIYNPGEHDPAGLKLILEHEKVHARQFHSADILIASLFQAVFWFNPISWLYKKTIEQNLEFIADNETVAVYGKKKEYQHTLLKVSVSDVRPALTNHFYQSFIKKRILMLNKSVKTKDQTWKVSLVLPILFIFMFTFNVKTEAQIVKQKEVEKSGTAFKEKMTISVTISKYSTEDNLKGYSRIFKKQNVNLQFNNISRSATGFITNIEATFEDLESGNKGEMTKSDAEGIEAFTFFKNDDGKIGFTSNVRRENYVFGDPSASTDLSKLGGMPLYVVSGKSYPAKSLRKKHISIKSGFEVLTKEKATQKYGAQGKDGALIIPSGKLIGDFKSVLKTIDSDNNNFMGDFIMIDNSGKPFLMSIDAKVTRPKDKGKNFLEKYGAAKGKAKNGKPILGAAVSSVTFSTSEKNEIKNELDSLKNQNKDIIAVQRKNSSGKLYNSGKEKPLFVIDGVVQSSDFNPKDINSENIANIAVLKGAEALHKYGQKAENGIVEIYTKNFKGNTNQVPEANFWYIIAEHTDEALANIKSSLKAKKAVSVDYNDIKRNNEGKITSISITARTEDGNNASASFSNTAGVPSIFLGLDKKGGLVISSNKLDANTKN